MKICITSQGDDLESQMDPRFGRCQYFIIADTDTFEFEAVKNPNIDAMGGAGIQSGQLIASKKVKAVLTGNVGPNAFQTLQAAGIEIITGMSGSVKEVIEKYKKGGLKPTQGPNAGSKHGMPEKGEIKEVNYMPFEKRQGSGQGGGMGRGQGGGMGRGGGRGMGRGGARGSQGKMGGTRPGAGPGGNCLCPSCGEKVSHQAGMPCYSVNCPKCGANMVRE
jgi:predicted Fe-Mo cluster-binding NifX family protein